MGYNNQTRENNIRKQQKLFETVTVENALRESIYSDRMVSKQTLPNLVAFVINSNRCQEHLRKESLVPIGKERKSFLRSNG